MNDFERFEEPGNKPASQAISRSGHGFWSWLIVLLGIALYLLIPVWTGAQTRHDNDFKHIYLGMQALLEGDEPYSADSLLLQAQRHGMANESLNPYVYLPFTGLALGFLAPLPVRAASLVWFALNNVFVLLSAWLIAATLFGRRRLLAFGLLLLALALSHPLLRNLTAGQLNAPLLLCYAGAFALLRRGRPASAGAVLGFAAMFKIAPGLFLLYLLLCRQWRALASMAATCAVLGVVSLLAVGLDVHKDFLPLLAQMGYGHSSWEQYGATFWKDPWNQSPNALLTHLLVKGNGVTQPWMQLSQAAANHATVAVSALLFGAYLVAALFAWRSDKETHEGQTRRFSACDEALFQATIALTLLLPSLMWDHYLMQLLLPAAWLVSFGLATRRHWGAGLALAALVLTELPWGYDSPAWRQSWGVWLMSMKLFPALLLFALACAASILAAKSPRKIAQE